MRAGEPKESQASVGIQPGLNSRALMGVFLLVFGLHQAAMASGRWLGYGFHRDELYYLDCASRLSFGYVDHSFLTPLLAWLSFGSLEVLQALAGAAFAGAAVLIAMAAREAGAGHQGQLFAAAAFAASPGAIAGSSMFGTTGLDQFAAALVVFAFLSCVRGNGGLALVLASSFLAGLAKPLGFVLVAAMAGWMLMENRRLAGAAAAACAAAGAGIAPLALWQQQAGWPMLEFARNIRADSDPALLALLMGLGLAGPVFLVLAAARWRSALESRTVWIALAGIVLVAASGGKSYYMFPFLLPLAVFCCAGVERLKGWLPACGASVLAASAMLWPVLPAGLLRWPISALNDAARERRGWTEWTHSVEEEMRRHGAGQVLALNYGQAGALSRLGRKPISVICGHNQHAFWPSPPVQPRVLVLGASEAWLKRHFADVKTVKVWETGLNNEEDGQTWRLAVGPLSPGALAREISHFD